MVFGDLMLSSGVSTYPPLSFRRCSPRFGTVKEILHDEYEAGSVILGSRIVCKTGHIGTGGMALIILSGR